MMNNNQAALTRTSDGGRDDCAESSGLKKQKAKKHTDCMVGEG